MITAEVSTYAGDCKPQVFPGLNDGPLGINRFNSPDGIGIDEDGNLFVFDSGNNKIRMIEQDGYVRTLIGGACFEYLMNPQVDNDYRIKNEYLLCFKYKYI